MGIFQVIANHFWRNITLYLFELHKQLYRFRMSSLAHTLTDDDLFEIFRLFDFDFGDKLVIFSLFYSSFQRNADGKYQVFGDN